MVLIFLMELEILYVHVWYINYYCLTKRSLHTTYSDVTRRFYWLPDVHSTHGDQQTFNSVTSLSFPVRAARYHAGSSSMLGICRAKMTRTAVLNWSMKVSDFSTCVKNITWVKKSLYYYIPLVSLAFLYTRKVQLDASLVTWVSVSYQT